MAPRLPLEAVVADGGRSREPGFHVGRLEQVPLPGEATPQCSIEPVAFAARADDALPARADGWASPTGTGSCRGTVPRILAGIRRLAEADARAARRAKESGAAGQVATVEPSQSTSPRHGTKVQ